MFKTLVLSVRKVFLWDIREFYLNTCMKNLNTRCVEMVDGIGPLRISPNDVSVWWTILHLCAAEHIRRKVIRAVNANSKR